MNAHKCVALVLILIFFLFTNSEPILFAGLKSEPSAVHFSPHFDRVTSHSAQWVKQGISRGKYSGALGRNHPLYFHVRFQMDMIPLAQYATSKKDKEILEAVLQAVEYSFKHQKVSGDFEVAIPKHINQKLGLGDLESATAFFLSALSTTLHILESSEWSQHQSDFVKRVNRFRLNIQRALQWLKSRSDILRRYDQEAPNRLFIDANAYYGLGQFLKDEQAKELGLQFAKAAVQLQHPEGYYFEGGGYDSSYQATNLLYGFYLLSQLDQSHAFKKTLSVSLKKGMDWEVSRILPSGEVSTEGNARVYTGGEGFLGAEKGVSYKAVYYSLIYAHYFMQDKEFLDHARRVYQYVSNNLV